MRKKRRELTAERLRELLAYHPVIGRFSWRVQRGRQHVGDMAGHQTEKGYRLIGVEGTAYMEHVLVWLWVTGEWPQYEVDHRDTDPSNNRWWNLRDVPTAVNAQNKRRARIDSATGLIGAIPNRDKFIARIKVGGVRHHLGTFDRAEDAHAAYVEAKRRMHEGCTL
jgi:hypothetical protein